MSKKQTEGKKLTQVQIKAICDKLERDFNPASVRPKNVVTDEQMHAANDKEIKKIINTSNLPTALKKLLVSKNHWDQCSIITELVNDANESEKVFAAIGAPYPEPNEAWCEWTVRNQHRAMLEDLKFELTMATADNYQKIMDDFNKKAIKALTA